MKQLFVLLVFAGIVLIQSGCTCDCNYCCTKEERETCSQPEFTTQWDCQNRSEPVAQCDWKCLD